MATAINPFIRDRDGLRFINVQHVAVARIFGDYVNLENPRGYPLGTVTLEAWQRFLQRQHGGTEGKGGRMADLQTKDVAPAGLDRPILASGADDCRAVDERRGLRDAPRR